MDLQTILTEEEKDLIRHFLDGRAIISRYNEETQQTRYMFKLLGNFYDFTGGGGCCEDAKEIGPHMTGTDNRIALSMILDGNIQKMDFSKYFREGVLTELKDGGKFYISPENVYLYEYYMNGSIWGKNNNQGAIYMFMKCYANMSGDLTFVNIRGVTKRDLDQIEKDCRDPFEEIED